jgi:hypothetical protein
MQRLSSREVVALLAPMHAAGKHRCTVPGQTSQCCVVM